MKVNIHNRDKYMGQLILKRSGIRAAGDEAFLNRILDGYKKEHPEFSEAELLQYIANNCKGYVNASLE